MQAQNTHIEPVNTSRPPCALWNETHKISVTRGNIKAKLHPQNKSSPVHLIKSVLLTFYMSLLDSFALVLAGADSVNRPGGGSGSGGAEGDMDGRRGSEWE